ncbi:hypothetical protein G5C65_10525 [Streptomyces sp. SB3404]|uniref:Uncharacterized protein n=1 Tax=Streptomyces boncukensis TaxID=2711219 RepID=A0A6G4WWD4_9ACTN|nr:hypothetical protein [Streptomyces boncukensis]
MLGAVCAALWLAALWRVVRGAADGLDGLEVSLAAGGWGLSLLPVHAAHGPSPRVSLTRASPRRRSGGGSGRW